MPKAKILLVSHKPFKIPEGECFVPIHAGRAIALEKSKDGQINNDDFNWMLENTIGDDTGDNISEKNRYYSECSALYWAWKNYDKLENPEYIGLMHYRRHFIFNDEYYENNIEDDWHRALVYKTENFIDQEYIENIGLNDENILKACENYDFVVTKDADFKLIYDYNLRENYEKTIPGSKVKDFDLLFNTIEKMYPEYKPVIDKNINGYTASLYQMFIMPRNLFFEYCEFLFGILFEVEKQINFEEYTTNGKRVLGYLAERILSVFVWKKQQEGMNILKLGVTQVEFPYTKEDIDKILEKGCPSYLKYLKQKMLSMFLPKDKQEKSEEICTGIRRSIQNYNKLKKIIK